MFAVTSFTNDPFIKTWNYFQNKWKTFSQLNLITQTSFPPLERVWMVQTEQQYICIHQCLMAVLEGKENTGPQREIHDNQGYEGESGRD